MPALNLPTNLALVEAWAGALYGSAVGQTTMAQVNSDIVSYGGLNNTLNAYYTAGFGSMTTIAIGNLVAANVGLTGAQATTGASIITATLNAAAPSARGTVVLNLLNTFAGLTADATWGVAATAWNTVVNTEITYNGSNATDNSLAIAATTVATQTTAANLAAAQALNKTITLTSGADVLTAGGGNDTFNALYSTAGGMTLQGTDTLDGGAGTDVLNVQIGVTGVTGVASMVNIETVSANFQAAGNLSLLNTTGITTLETSSGTADATFSNIPSATVVLKDTNNSNNATFGFAAAAVAGAADVANLTISGVTGGTVTLAGIETVNITSTGAANTIAGLTATAATSVKVAGDQGLTITAALGATVATIDASANTAVGGTGGSGVTVIMGAVVATATGTGGSGNDSFNFTSPLGAVILSGGAGNDTFTSTTSLTGDSIDGGAGTDIVATNASIAEQYSTPATRLIVNNETLSLLSQGTSGATLTVANIDTSMVRVNLAGNATGAVAGGTSGAYTIAGPAGTFTVAVGGATGTGASTLGGLLTLTSAGTATTDAASLLNTTVSNNNVFNGQAITSTGYETLTINSGTGASTNSAAQTLGAITITPSTSGVGALSLTGNNPITIGAVTGAKTIDASAMAGAATLTMSSAAGVATTNITGTGGNDTIIAATATAATIIGGAGNDTITGSTLADTISGGDGNDTITGGLGRDTLTGGAGVDTFVYAVNATGSVVSSLAAPDTITDFTSGTDKLQIGQTITAFIGTFGTASSAQAAAAADGRGNLAYFVSGENNLYVVAATNGVASTTDTVITLSGVTTIVAGDLSLGSQGTGATLSLTAAANLSTTTSTNASGLSTGSDDAISSTAAFLAGSTVNGGLGNDTLTISTAPTTAVLTTLLASSSTGATVTGVENIRFTLGTTNLITMPNDVNLSVTNASATAASTITLGTGTGQSFTATGTGTNTIIISGANAAINGGAGVDNITFATGVSPLGSTINGGAGLSDILTLTDASTTLVFTSGAASAAATSMNGIETLQLGGAVNTITSIINDAAITINGGSGVTTIGGSTAGVGTITVAGAAATAVNLSGVNVFAVTASATTGTITDTGTAGTLSVTASANAQTVVSSVPTTIVGAGLGAIETIDGAGAFTVTGLGTVASGAITEATTHTGALTVTTASSNASTVTETATTGAVGAVNINEAGTLTLTIVATANHGATNVISSGANATTVSGGGTLNYSVSGTASAHTIISTTTGAAGDTVVGGSAVDTVTLGAGPDRFTTGGGNDIFNIIALSDTGIASGIVVGAVPAQSQTINVSGMDVITGFSPGASIVITTQAASTASATGYVVVRNGGTLGANTTNDMALLTGDYNSTTGIFTVNSGGASSLMAFDDNGVVAGGVYRGVVLVGYVDAGGADTFTGSGTTVHTFLSVA